MLWNEFVDRVGLSPDTPHEEWAFGSDPDALASLVLAGTKTGTASLYDAYTAENAPIPKVGAYSVLLDSQGRELCILQNHTVEVLPFSQVDHYHAYTEGEGDRSLAYWRRVHWSFFTEEAKASGVPLKEDPLVVLEQFHVVYPTKKEEPYSLLPATVSLKERIQEYKDAFCGRLEELHGTAGLGRRDDLSSWLQESLEYRKPDYVSSEETVRATQLFLMENKTGRILGAIHMRHDLSSNLLFSGGHIGYSVRPDERRKGYASLMLRSVLPYAKALGLEKVLVTCETWNEGSRKTILLAGGCLENTVYDEEEKAEFQRYWIVTTQSPLSQTGSP